MQLQHQFDEIARLIRAARSKAFYEINRTVIELYWEVGKYISRKVESEGWGKNVVEELANYLADQIADTAGFSARNLWRMKQFFETYKNAEFLSPLVTEVRAFAKQDEISHHWREKLLVASCAKNSRVLRTLATECGEH